MNDEDGFIAIYGEWTKIGIECLMIVVYAPQNYSKKCCLWNHLNSLIHNFHATSIVLGDFNEVRDETERMGTSFCKYGAKIFNYFINNSELVDLPIGGKSLDLKLRLQELKKEIRLWRQNTVLNNDALCRELKTKIEHFDVKAELGFT
ncbi:RNA-directed DNA polymerase, eukaryota [Tanacetum coccineum]